MLMVRKLGAGGTERQFTEAAKRLDRSKFSPHICCFVEEFRAEELRAAGLPIVRIPLTSYARPSTIVNARMLGRYLREHRIELVHTFDHPANIFGVPASSYYQVPAVLSSSRSLRNLRTPRDRKLLRIADRLADAIVVNCEAVKRDLIEGEGIPADRIRVWYNGIDLAKFSREPRVRPAPLADAELVIGVVALLRPEKGLDTLMNAFGKVARSRPGARLLLVGSGEMEEPLKQQAAQLGVAAQCWFEPTAKDVGPWLRGIDIFVLPSRSEALSNSIMEAMASGCAVMASRVGGNPELVLHGQTGLLFEAANSADLAGKMERLIQDPALRAHLAETGYQRIRTEFPLDVSVRRLEAIYEEFLSRAKR